MPIISKPPGSGKTARQREMLEALRRSDELMLLPSDIAPILGCDAQSIRIQADTDPAALGFRIIRVGARTLIPRVPFIEYVTGCAVTTGAEQGA